MWYTAKHKLVFFLWNFDLTHTINKNLINFVILFKDLWLTYGDSDLNKIYFVRIFKELNNKIHQNPLSSKFMGLKRTHYDQQA